MTPHADVYAHEGVYTPAETLIVRDNMSLYGGMKARLDELAGEVRGWTRAFVNSMPSVRSEVSSLATTALRVLDISSRTVIDGFTIRSADGVFRAGQPGENSIGIYVRNATDVLEIRKNVILAGQGAPGASGVDRVPRNPF